VLAAALVAAMLATTVALFAGAGPALRVLGFSSAPVLSGELWRIISYGLVNPPSLSFALEVVMLVWFGREVEKTMGRAPFLQLAAGVYLVKPLLFTAAGPWFATSFTGATLSFPLFIAFATLFPGVPLLFNILAKWAALALVGIYALMALAERRWDQLADLAAGCGFAHVFVRFAREGFSLPRFRWPRRSQQASARPPARIAPRPAPVPAPATRAGMAEVDALLDKIAQHGIHSLTREERARLEAARTDLLRRGSGGG
jgi:hypothetical protein